jgi:hypothetical protein
MKFLQRRFRTLLSALGNLMMLIVDVPPQFTAVDSFLSRKT